MMCTCLRSSRHYILSVRLMGTVSHKMVATDKPAGLLTASLAFDDPRAFQVKSMGELLRALAIFRFCSFPVLVNNCDKLMSVARSILGRRLFSSLLRPTVYAQFVAGENEKEISKSMEKMSLLGLRPMLAVPIEEDLGESTGEKRYNDNMEAMLECVRMSHSNSWSKDPMMQLKITALLSPELCVKLTNVISKQPYDLDLLVRAMNGETVNFPGLEEREAVHFHCSLRRLNRIAEASINKVRVLVDAEYTFMNPAMSLVTMAMMKKFNKDGAWIWNTYQCYLKETRTLLLEALAQSKDEAFCLGVKLVRGAYMDKERKLAVKEGRPDPIQDCWEDTNDNYNGLLEMMLKVIAQDPGNYRIIVATHNEESVRRAAKWVEELGIDKKGGCVCFGQLLGMCDHVSLTLAKEGYAVYKSVPYGSVDDTLPYLVRRAQENRTVLQGIRKERDLLRKEFLRRLRRSN
ncbi:hydroxyproline dehydrogenase isoform X1 [Dunckerocampus dactyliophorus]|uniref:hydroxyproline dehydrogenase isoform X1 n=1 Tax=Dunckerocampus dactyliophorus TaxID=161453 RepID=UPI00240645B5|nr:hydroxyproline dehydrogenase isoform X1 [Dunckerocampus dactyliophorus]XP_054623196.1 hydroxyproline dehydrogenase isoform X1 [Dunckerocampus dactyliophorus]XP_054623197.1 hydroxyproline dehydrogenase isoform X1 [Dunckerocampus dactyliophorus]XP_054623198.1 hydroxyproline dehydrogenase isoform X1 [Dunckerocampus dactyliophorus]